MGEAVPCTKYTSRCVWTPMQLISYKSSQLLSLSLPRNLQRVTARNKRILVLVDTKVSIIRLLVQLLLFFSHCSGDTTKTKRNTLLRRKKGNNKRRKRVTKKFKSQNAKCKIIAITVFHLFVCLFVCIIFGLNLFAAFSFTFQSRKSWSRASSSSKAQTIDRVAAQTRPSWASWNAPVSCMQEVYAAVSALPSQTRACN